MAIDETPPRVAPAAFSKSDREPLILEAQATSPDDAPLEPTWSEPDPTAAAAKTSKLVLICAAFGVACLTMLAGYSWRQFQLASETHSDLKGDVSALRDRVAENEQRTVTAGGLANQYGALEKRLQAVEQKPATTGASSETASALDKRIAALETAAKNNASAAIDLPQLTRRIAALEATPKPAPTAALPQSAPPPIDLAPLQTKLTALETRMVSIETTLLAPKSELRATETPTARAPRETNAAALAILAQSIRASLERGESFAPELAAAENLGADAAQLAALAPAARGGAPTARKLAQTFRPLTRSIVDSAAPTDADASVLDRLTNAATKLVRVRPVGEAGGGDAASLVAQIEQALDRGAVAPAMAAWTLLPAPARQTSEAWAQDARRRVAADAAAAALFNSAIADLGRKRSAP